MAGAHGGVREAFSSLIPLSFDTRTCETESHEDLIIDHHFLCSLPNLFRQSAVYAEMTGPRLPFRFLG